MPRLVLILLFGFPFGLPLGLAFSMAGAACTSGPSPNPLAGDWRVDRTVRNATAGCPSLTLAPLAMTLRPGFQDEIDLGPREASGSNNTIEGNHIMFASSEFAYLDTSDMLIIVHDLEIENSDVYLMGTAFAQGDGAQLGCRWNLDAVANRAPH